jgi:hypothetical protein
MFSFPMRPEEAWPGAFKRLIGLQRGIVGALAANFAAILFSIIVTFLAPAFARTLLLCLAS